MDSLLKSVSISILLLGTMAAQAAPEVKVALLGDTSSGNNFGSVLKLVSSEKSDVVMINGDLGYYSSPRAWINRIRSSIDVDQYPIIGTLGNHDLGGNEQEYINHFQSLRTVKNQLNTKCSGGSGLNRGQDIIAVDEVCSFENVTIIASAIGQVMTADYHESRFEEKLKKSPKSNWKLAGYHYTLSSMNPGIKSDENTHKFFDLIRQYGVLGVQAHTHSAMASCPINSEFKKGKAVTCHPDFHSNIEERFILPGTTIYMDSSLGGKDVRRRGRCRNPAEKGCEHMIDLITGEGYTRIDGIKKTDFNPFGALFIIFNYNGDENKAFVYYKSIDGQTIFKFTIQK